MSALSRFRSVATTLVLASALACAVNPPPRVGVAYVSTRPPVARVEVIPIRPGAAHIWIAGYWGWRAQQYAWVPGRWDVPGPGFRRWENGRWMHDRHGWFWVEGRWR
jgi:hypothetical protein